MIDELIALYRGPGLLENEHDNPLYDVCCNSAFCWGEDESIRPATPAGISVPWIGERYVPGGLCVVGMNFNNWGGLRGHWQICQSHIDEQRQGNRGKEGRFFAYGAMGYARLLDSWMRGEPIPDDYLAPAPEHLAPVWQSCAYLQAVKCSPVGNRSRPTDAMCHRCPEFLLLDELELMKPGVVLLLGRGPTRDVVRPLLNPTWGCAPGHMEQDTFDLGYGTARLFCCNHPAARNRDRWKDSVRQLHGWVTSHSVEG